MQTTLLDGLDSTLQEQEFGETDKLLSVHEGYSVKIWKMW